MPSAEQKERTTIERPTGELDPMASLGADVRSGLGSRPKTLRSKYHYDARGSELFVQITQLPEYYPTRTEVGILEQIAEDVIADTRPCALIEFGSGAARKTQILLDEMSRAGCLEGYAAIEVSESALLESANELTDRYDALRFVGVLADFEAPVQLPFDDRPRLILFLGSTIGNLTSQEAVDFLEGVRSHMNPADRFLIGFDLVKDVSTLIAAYNDSAGVTAEFSLNVLNVINRELEGDIPVSAFRHEGIWNPDEARIEAYLTAERAVDATLEAIDLAIHWDAGETIRTELCHKYTKDSVEALVTRAGLRIDRWDTDEDDRFALALTSC